MPAGVQFLYVQLPGVGSKEGEPPTLSHPSRLRGDPAIMTHRQMRLAALGRKDSTRSPKAEEGLPVGLHGYACPQAATAPMTIGSSDAQNGTVLAGRRTGFSRMRPSASSNDLWRLNRHSHQHTDPSDGSHFPLASWPVQLPMDGLAIPHQTDACRSLCHGEHCVHEGRGGASEWTNDRLKGNGAAFILLHRQQPEHKEERMFTVESEPSRLPACGTKPEDGCKREGAASGCRCLEEKLAYLEHQRRIAQQKCEAFLLELESAMAAGENGDGDDDVGDDYDGKDVRQVMQSLSIQPPMTSQSRGLPASNDGFSSSASSTPARFLSCDASSSVGPLQLSSSTHHLSEVADRPVTGQLPFLPPISQLHFSSSSSPGSKGATFPRVCRQLHHQRSSSSPMPIKYDIKLMSSPLAAEDRLTSSCKERSTATLSPARTALHSAQWEADMLYYNTNGMLVEHSNDCSSSGSGSPLPLQRRHRKRQTGGPSLPRSDSFNDTRPLRSSSFSPHSNTAPPRRHSGSGMGVPYGMGLAGFIASVPN